MIRLIENYAIDADEHQFILGEVKTRTITRNGNQITENYLVKPHYFTQLRSAILCCLTLCEKNQVQGELKNLEDFEKSIKEIEERLKEAVDTVVEGNR